MLILQVALFLELETSLLDLLGLDKCDDLNDFEGFGMLMDVFVL